MSKAAATREDVNEVLDLMRQFMQQTSDEFEKARVEREEIRADIRSIFTYLDNIEKQLEIDTEERIVMGHQLNRLDAWVHELADKIGHDLKA